MGTQNSFSAGVRSSLRDNAKAYGFSVSITASFGLVSTAHAHAAFVWQSILFALGAAAAFVSTEAVASRLLPKRSLGEPGEVALIAGATDLLAIAAAVGVAVPLAQVPGLVAWPLTAFGATLVYLIVGGFDIMAARWLSNDRDKSR